MSTRLLGYAEPRQTIVWIVAVCSVLAGVQIIYSIQFAIGSPLFHDKLGIPQQTVGIILATAGPISGFIVQPVIGVISDNFSAKFGRRRPFIVVGVVFAVIGMIMIALCTMIEDLLNPVFGIKDHTIGVTMAITGLWMMNLFTNVIQGPARALVNDIVNDKSTANSVVVFVMSLSAVIASVGGAQFVPQDQAHQKDYQKEPFVYLFLIGAGTVFALLFPTTLAAKEKQYTGQTEKTNILMVFVKIFKAFVNMPKQMVMVVVLFFFSWCAYTPLMIYQTQYYQDYIFGGESFGLRIGMYSLGLFSTVSFLFSLIQPTIMEKIGVKQTYFITQMIATGCFLMIALITLFFPDIPNLVYYVLASTTLVGINFTAFNSIPFAIVTDITGGKDLGLFMGVLNSAAVVSQTFTTILLSTTVLNPALFDLDKNSRLALSIGSGSIFSFIAMVLVCFLPSQEKNETVLR